MTSLRDLSLRPSYRKGRDDIAYDFYLPCMEISSRYDRAVGFFRSSIFSLTWPSLREFVTRGGRMRLLCSPIIHQEDIAALSEGYSARLEEETVRALHEEIEHLLQDQHLEKPTRVLASLVAIQVIDIKIVFMGPDTDAYARRLFHDKLGIFKDSSGNYVTFKGSMNETYFGLSLDGNLESVDVFVSWGGEREMSRVLDEATYFESLWENDYHSSVVVKPFPEAVRERLLREANTEQWPVWVNEISEDIERRRSRSADRVPGGRIPLPHQAAALEEWHARDRRGVLEHATGAGKTFTALCAIRGSLEKNEVPLVVVPSLELFRQWYAELRSTFADLDLQILRCGAGHGGWRVEDLLRPWSTPGAKARLILTTLQTAATEAFLRGIRGGEHLFLIADEVHHLGSPRYQEVLGLDSGPRLGLSATPRRAGDPEGTRAILEYFGGVIPPPFTLRDGIATGVLTPYFYHVHPVQLTVPEQEEWNAITAEMARLIAIHGRDHDEAAERLFRLAIARAHVAKQASGKVNLSLTVARTHYEAGQHWIIYCDSQVQMRQVLDQLTADGLPARGYYSEMTGHRQATLLEFEINAGILVAIRCLDEGVDIPVASHALILASSKNPREFIQRRGRLLRRSPGKHFSNIHDAIVVPESQSRIPAALSLVESELARAIHFGSMASNSGCIADLQRIAIRHGLDPDLLFEGGYEDDA